MAQRVKESHCLRAVSVATRGETVRSGTLRFCVLGGNGFIGSHLTDALLQAGHEVRVFDRSPERHRQPSPAIERTYGDLRDVVALRNAVVGIDVVVHLISSSAPATPGIEPAEDVTGNLVGTLRLLEMMREARCRRIIFLSSGGAIYGDQVRPSIDESHPTDPLSSYGIVKLATEKYIQLFHRLHGLEFTIFRPSNPYGERQLGRQRVGLISAALAATLRAEPLPIWGDGTVIRDFFYVGDLAEAIVTAVERGASGIFNLGGGQGIAVNDVISLVGRITGRPLRVHYGPARPVDPHSNVLDVRHAEAVLGWRPRTPLDAGIERTWNWLRAEARAASTDRA